MLRTILAGRGVQSPFQQDWLDLNPTVCSNSTGPSRVKSDILSYWVWVILAQTYWRYLGNSGLWPAIWLFILRVCYQQTELAHPQSVLMPAVLKNLLRLCSITFANFVFLSISFFLWGVGESKFKAILSVPGFPKFSGSLQNLQQPLIVVVCNCTMEWDKKWLSHWSVWRHLHLSRAAYSTADLELHALAELCVHCLCISSPKYNRIQEVLDKLL